MKLTAQINSDLSLLLPELGTVACIVVAIIVGLITRDPKNHKILFGASLVGILTLNILQLLSLATLPKVFLFSDHIIVSAKMCYVKCLLTFVCILYFIYKELKPLAETAISELHTTVLAQLLGCFMVIQAGSYVTLFLGIELVSITSYIIAYFGNSDKAKISAMKYFLFGAFSSALMVYGISWMYGITGSYFINEFPKVYITAFDESFHYLALICLYAGLFFKISAIPFHLWTPDVYKGVPNSLLAILSLLPKISGLLALYHIHSQLTLLPIFGTISWHYLFAISIITMLMGNIIALRQVHFKTLFAFSSIAQTGLLLVLIPSQNIDMLLFYLSFYILMNVSLLFIYELFAKGDPDTELKTLSGLGLHHPSLGILLLIAVTSLIGIPPFIGFIGKVFIINSLFSDSFSLENIKSLTGIVVVFTTLISLVYYLRIPYYLFVKKYEDSDLPRINKKQVSFSAILVLPLIIGFFSFDWLLQWLQCVK